MKLLENEEIRTGCMMLTMFAFVILVLVPLSMVVMVFVLRALGVPMQIRGW